MNPEKWYLCYRCALELAETLKLEKLDDSSTEKGECKMCHRKCYGRWFMVSYKGKGENNG